MTAADTVRLPAARALFEELWSVAIRELGDVIDAYDAGGLTVDQAVRLAGYLRDELAAGGKLSTDHAREAGLALGRERQQARRVLAVIERELADRRVLSRTWSA